ncbi:hypothetical protein [Methylobacter sp.]|uniref:hypothetical protein n=1 Tax=Methylobacter sp. TaxID=2051955 RepID=UPI0024871093|nr:hypothetical protein [Methylobacter sp.]MDI1276710.1 hypothetical protein [Methylobacter sp.]MDI1357378.1 hypothetical protein [Methylobacter sp.]
MSQKTFPGHVLSSINALLERLPSGAQGSAQNRIFHEAHGLKNELSKLSELINSPDEMLSDLGNSLRIEAQRKIVKLRHDQLGDASKNFVEASRADLTKKRFDAANLKQNEYAAELRAVFREIKPADRPLFMQNLIESRDSASVAALTESPSSLTGLSSDLQNQYRQSYLDRFTTNNTSELDNLQEVSSTILDAVYPHSK